MNEEYINSKLEEYIRRYSILRLEAIKRLVREMHNDNTLKIADDVIDYLLGINSEYDERSVNIEDLEKEYGPEKYVYQDTIYEFIRYFINGLNLNDTDIFYDLGSGYGRVIIYAGITTPAVVKGIEIVPKRALHSIEVIKKLEINNVEVIRGNVVHQYLNDGTVFFLFNPFSSNTFYLVSKLLKKISFTKQIRIASVGTCTEHFRELKWLDEVATYSVPPYWEGSIFESKAHLLD